MESHKLALSFLLNQEAQTKEIPSHWYWECEAEDLKKIQQGEGDSHPKKKGKGAKKSGLTSSAKDEDRSYKKEASDEIEMPSFDLSLLGPFRDDFLQKHAAELQTLLTRSRSAFGQQNRTTTTTTTQTTTDTSPPNFPARSPSPPRTFSPLPPDPHGSQPDAKNPLDTPLLPPQPQSAYHVPSLSVFPSRDSTTTTTTPTHPETTTNTTTATTVESMRRWMEDPEGIEIVMTKKAWKGRKKPTRQQREFLEGFFWHNPYPDAETRDKIAEMLRMDTKTICTWFQNKRSRHKKAGKNRVLFHSVNEEGKKRKKDQ